jgi:hypothetical protein
MLGNSGFSNEAQLRQEVNTSLLALKREAFNLETLINQAAKTLTDVNNRIAALENVQGDYVKKTDITDTIESGNMNPVTSNAVYDNSFKMLLSENNDPDNYPTDAVRIYKVRNYSTLSWLGDDGFIITIPWNNNYIFQIAVDDQSNFCAVRSKSQTWNSWQKIIKSSDVVDTITSDNPEPVSSSAVYDTLINGGVWSSIKSGMGTSFMYKKIGNFVSLHINTTNNALKFTANATNMQYSDNTDVVLPNAILPQRDTNIILIDNTHDSMFHARIFGTGVIRAWKNSDYEPQNVASWNADIIYRID